MNLTRKVFVGAIDHLQLIGLPGTSEFPDEKMKAWYKYLSDIPEKAFIEAVNKIAKECKFFPTIAEIRELCNANQGQDDEALIIWNKLVSTADFYSPPELDAITKQCVDGIGGYGEICHGQQKNMPFMEKRFIDLYQALKREAVKKAQEMENNQKAITNV